MVGMMVGGAIGGILGDKFGRRVALLGSVVTFGVLTIGVAVRQRRQRRSLSCGFSRASASAARCRPRRRFHPMTCRRAHVPFAVTLTVICIPLGGAFAGWIGGYSPAALRLARAVWRRRRRCRWCSRRSSSKVLPESPRYMARLQERWGELRAMLRRLGHNVPDDDAVFVDSREEASVKQASIGELFVPGVPRGHDRAARLLSSASLGAYMGTNWVPSMLDRREVRRRHRQLRPDWRGTSACWCVRARRRVHHSAYRLARHDADDARGRIGCRLRRRLAMMDITPRQRRAGVRHARHRPAASSTPRRRRCMRWRRTCIRRRFAGTGVGTTRGVRPHRRRAQPDHRRASRCRSRRVSQYTLRVIAGTMTVAFSALADRAAPRPRPSSARSASRRASGALPLTEIVDI